MEAIDQVRRYINPVNNSRNKTKKEIFEEPPSSSKTYNFYERQTLGKYVKRLCGTEGGFYTYK